MHSGGAGAWNKVVDVPGRAISHPHGVFCIGAHGSDLNTRRGAGECQSVCSGGSVHAGHPRSTLGGADPFRPTTEDFAGPVWGQGGQADESGADRRQKWQERTQDRGRPRSVLGLVDGEASRALWRAAAPISYASRVPAELRVRPSQTPLGPLTRPITPWPIAPKTWGVTGRGRRVRSRGRTAEASRTHPFALPRGPGSPGHPVSPNREPNVSPLSREFRRWRRGVRRAGRPDPGHDGATPAGSRAFSPSGPPSVSGPGLSPCREPDHSPAPAMGPGAPHTVITPPASPPVSVGRTWTLGAAQ